MELDTDATTPLRSKLREHAKTYTIINPDNIFEKLAELIDLAERVLTATPAEKRAAVLEVIALAIEALPDSEDKTNVLEMLRSGVIEKSINIAISVSKLPLFHRLCSWLKSCCA